MDITLSVIWTSHCLWYGHHTVCDMDINLAVIALLWITQLVGRVNLVNCSTLQYWSPLLKDQYHECLAWVCILLLLCTGCQCGILNYDCGSAIVIYRYWILWDFYCGCGMPEIKSRCVDIECYSFSMNRHDVSMHRFHIKTCILLLHHMRRDNAPRNKVHAVTQMMRADNIESLCVNKHVTKIIPHSPWAQRGHRAPPPPPGSSMSGIILFGGPHWSIIEMLTPYKLGRPHIFGHFSKWPPSKSSENWIAHILAFGQPRSTNLVSKPTFSRSLNPIGML